MPIRRPTPPQPAPVDDPLLEQALSDLDWYARARDRARRWHWATELGALLTGAATVVAAGIRAPAAATATLAGLTVFIGGFRQVFNHAERHVLSAEAWSRLRLAIRRYRLIPEEERDEAVRRRLQEEIEDVATTEVQNWAAGRRGLRPGPGPVPGGQLPQ
ncbi:SLATT domain-containing protein [Streptomyces sp. TLI_146]|uniref:SLATT domain-containing protein n=1 Tax=Streptomyces sp. TLI_146 TaxID=1938858 RepID=UPI000C70B163|nr:SLATT domain-containing protein [Streptomyces sp. TLI_146]